MLLDATGSAFQLIGVALFTVLLLRDGESARSAVLALVGTALLLKAGAAPMPEPGATRVPKSIPCCGGESG